MSNFNLSAKDVSDPNRIFEEMFKDAPNGLVSSRSRSDTPTMNLNMYTLSEILMRTPAMTSPTDLMEMQQGIIGGALGSVWDEETATESGFANLFPKNLRDMLFAISEDDEDGSGGGGGAGSGDADSGGDGDTSGGAIEGEGEQLSENFRLSEFNSRIAGAPPSSSVASLRWLCVNVLEPLREEFGAARITSGYRSRAHNNEVGGATNSRHIYDNHPTSPAVDISFASGSSGSWASRASELLNGGGGIGIYPGGHVHIDNRSATSRW